MTRGTLGPRRTRRRACAKRHRAGRRARGQTVRKGARHLGVGLFDITIEQFDDPRHFTPTSPLTHGEGGDLQHRYSREHAEGRVAQLEDARADYRSALATMVADATESAALWAHPDPGRNELARRSIGVRSSRRW